MFDQPTSSNCGYNVGRRRSKMLPFRSGCKDFVPIIRSEDLPLVKTWIPVRYEPFRSTTLVHKGASLFVTDLPPFRGHVGYSAQYIKLIF